MQRSLFAAISGLNNHQTRMDVIGNNIANVNTTAFKSSRVSFSDILSQTLRGAEAPQENRGGINSIQVGLGMQVAAIDNNHTQGNLQSTGRATDMAIQGSGFFIINDGLQNFYTRDGSFSRGSDGYLFNPGNGFKLMGWQADAAGNIDETGPLAGLHIPLGLKSETRATAEMFFGGNLNAAAEVASIYTLESNVFDSLGNVHTLEIRLEKTADNQWNWDIDIIEEAGPLFLGAGTIDFNEQGTVAVDPATGEHLITGDIPLIITPPGGAAEMEVNLDLASLTQLVGRSDVLMRRQDGFPMGILHAFDISTTGVITGAYTNGMTTTLGQIALSRFENPEGLTRSGDNMFQISASSGEPFTGIPGTQGRGTVRTATLEMSNVNMAFEFTEMITTSRAFQANSRVITSSNELLQEIVNLVR